MTKKKTTEQPVFTERIQQGADGKYRWTYKLHMLKTSSIISEVFWALLITCLITWFIVFCLLLFSGEMSWEQFFASLGMIVLVLAILCVLCIPAYLIVAAMYGWYYIIRFTMDEDGITHEQLPRQMKKAQTLGCIVALVGLLAKRPTTAGSGMLAASHSQLYSRFTHVKSVKAKRRQHLIRVNETLTRNMIYVCDEDFDFVYDFIRSRCKKVKG